MKKYTKKLLALAMVLAMVLSFGVSAYALNINYLAGDGLPSAADECSTYRADLVTPVTSGSISVTLIMEAGDAFSWDYNYGASIPNSKFYAVETKTLSNANGVTVLDLLNAVDASNNYGLDLVFASNYLSAVNSHVSGQTATWSSGGQWGFDGWVFRVNDLFPVKAVGSGYQGTAVNETYLHDGDIVHFFYDAPSNFDEDTIPAANYVRARYLDRDEDGVYIQMESHDTFIDQFDDWTFYVNEYTPLGEDVGVDIYSYSNGILTYVDTYDTDEDGILTLEDTLNAGTYIAMTESSYYNFTNTDWDIFFNNTTYLKYVSAYSKFVVEAIA